MGEVGINFLPIGRYKLAIQGGIDEAGLPCGLWPISPKGVGLDRLDNRFGYFLGNVYPCCGECNRIRGDTLTIKEAELVCYFLSVWRSELPGGLPAKRKARRERVNLRDGSLLPYNKSWRGKVK